jgi:membrane protease YdiL (CAAX protease family)
MPDDDHDNADRIPEPAYSPLPDEAGSSGAAEPWPPEANPYGLQPGEEPVLAEVVPAPPGRPRIWPTLLVGFTTLPVSWVVAGVVLGLAALLYYGPAAMQPAAGMPEWIADFVQTRVGLLVVILPGQCVFLAAALGAALLSPEPLRYRLALQRGVASWWQWIVLALATPIVGLGSSLLLSVLVDEPSEQLRLMSEMMRVHAQGGFLVVLSLLVIVLPGIVEELLFRGYLQSRLLRRWPPLAANGLSTLLFAAAHMDPLHVIGVLPLGIWLGVVAWRTGSVWPAVLCHASNNAAALAGAVYGNPDVVDFTWDPVTIAALSVGVPAMLISLVILAMARPAHATSQWACQAS